MNSEPTASLVAERLRRSERVQIAMGVIVAGGMFVIIVLLTIALLRASTALTQVEQTVEDNCYNVTVLANYFDSLDASLTHAIRTAPPGQDLSLIRELVDQARIARDAMIVPICQEVQG